MYVIRNDPNGSTVNLTRRSSGSRPPLSDRCPQCCGRAFIPPSYTRPDGEGTRCDYRCPKCGHTWFTGWLTATLYPEWLPFVEQLAAR